MPNLLHGDPVLDLHIQGLEARSQRSWQIVRLSRWERVTLGRAALLPCLVVAIMSRLPVAACSVLIGFVIADILDGIAARRADADSVVRRILDALTDRVGIHIAFLSYAITWHFLAPVWIALIFKDSVQAVASRQALQRNLVMVGGPFHKIVGLGVFSYGLSLLLFQRTVISSLLALPLTLAILYSAATYHRNALKVLRDPWVSGVVRMTDSLR